MGSARDGSPEANRTIGLAHRALQDRVQPLPLSGIVPPTPSRPPGVFSKSDAELSPLVSVSIGVSPLSRQPKLVDRLREALRAPVLKAYLKQAPGARPHLPIPKEAPLSQLERISSQLPVFRVVPR